MDALRANFRPEFLNRIDEVIVFHALTRDQIGEIVEIQMDTVAKRLADRRINWSCDARRDVTGWRRAATIRSLVPAR